MKVEYLEGDDGSLIKVLMSEEPFKTLHLTDNNREETSFCLVLTEEIEKLIKQQA